MAEVAILLRKSKLKIEIFGKDFRQRSKFVIFGEILRFGSKIFVKYRESPVLHQIFFIWKYDCFTLAGITKGNEIFVNYRSQKGDHKLFWTYRFCLHPPANLTTRVLITPTENLKKNEKMGPSCDVPESTRKFGPRAHPEPPILILT